MKLSEYMAVLQAAQDDFGDLDVVERNPFAPLGAIRRAVKAPAVHSLRVKTSREKYEKIVLIGDEPSGERVFVL